MFAVLLTTATFLQIVSQNTSAKVTTAEATVIQGTCFKNYPPNETLYPMTIKITGGSGGPWYAIVDYYGQYSVSGNFYPEITYTVEAKSLYFDSNGGWKGVETVYVSCEDPPCSFGVQTKNVTCRYYDSPY
jgi:hypothetical protein